MAALIISIFIIALVGRYTGHLWAYSKSPEWDLHAWALFTESALFWLCIFALPFGFTKSLLLITGIDFMLWGFLLQGLINTSVDKPWFNPNESSHFLLFGRNIPRPRGYQRVYQGAAGILLVLAATLIPGL